MNENPEDLVGQELAGRFRLSFYRGSGHFCRVYEGEILSMGRPVGRCAVKLLELLPEKDPEQAQEKLRQACSYKHPGLVDLQAVGALEPDRSPRLIYVTSELSTQSLRRHLTRVRTLEDEEVRGLARALAEGLEYLHDRGVRHGELRPSNVLQCQEVWKLSEYELSILQGWLLRLEPGSDTLHYCAPEHALGHAEPASDLWALGCVLHECLTGHHPFAHLAGSTPTELAYRAEHEGPHMEGGLSPTWNTALRGCFTIRSGARMTARQLLDCLEGRPVEVAQEASPTGPPRPSVLGSGEPPPRKKDGTVELEPLPNMPPLTTPAASRPQVPLAAMLGVGMFLLIVLGLTIVLHPGKPGPKGPGDIPAAQLYPMPYETVKLNRMGRVMEETSGEAQGYAEDLGEGVDPLEFVQVRGGEFVMGGPDGEPEALPEERPCHRVQLGGYFIGRREVTQAQWKAVAAFPQVRIALRAEPSSFQGEDLPVESVTCDEAVEFCARLSARSGRPYRLPTEAEWEYACRAGTQSPFCFGDTLTPDVACYNATQNYAEGPLGSEPLKPILVGDLGAANGYGLLDVHGNVAEWCQDFFAPYPADAGRPLANPTGPARGIDHVVRGGGWSSSPRNCRSAARSRARGDQADNNVGLRIVGAWTGGK